MQISKNFTLAELTKSQVATRKGINNTPNEGELKNIKELVANILQPLRDKIGAIIISSCFRCPRLNRAIGGANTSQHIYGKAADIESPSMSNYELAKYIMVNFKFDQLILEFPDKNDGTAGWVHVSWNGSGNRNQILTATRINGRTVYLSGLVL